MSAGPPLPAIVSAGAVTALARGCLASAMLARATRLVPRTAHVRDPQGYLISAGRAPDLPPNVHGALRFSELAVPAFREALEGVSAAAGDAPMPVLVALPEIERADMVPAVGSVVLDAVAEAGGPRVDRAASEAIFAGRAGFAEVVARALALLAGHRAQAVVVGGVDSLWHPRLLRALWHEGRLTGGLVPSEAAAFLVIAPRTPPGVLVARAAAVLAPPREGAAILEPGAAYAALVRGAITGLAEPPRWVLGDGNGEAQRATEWARIAQEVGLADAFEERVCERCGDVGAAAGALACAFAWTRFRTASAPASTALVALASEGGPSGAVVLHGGEVAPRRAPREEKAAWPTCRMAEAARDVLETVRDVPWGLRSAPLRAALDAAWTSLGRVEHARVIDGAHLAQIEEAIVKARAVFDLAESDASSSVRAIAAAVERTLVRARGAAIDHLATMDATVPRPAASAPPFLASVGAASVHAVPITARPFEALFGERGDVGASDEESAAEVPRSDKSAVERARGDESVAERARGDQSVAERARGKESVAERARGKESVAERARGDESAVGDGVREAEAPAESAAAGAEREEEPGAWRRAALRTCLETMARLSALREPRPGDTPEKLAVFEQRLFDHLDALAAVAASAADDGVALDVSAEVIAFGAEAVRDPSHAFVRAFVLGCLASDDAAREAALALARSEPVTHAAQASALAIASSPHVRGAMERLCRSPDPVLVRIGLEVLRARAEATFATAALLVHHPEALVRVRAARALGRASEPAAAAALCARLAKDESDAEVARALAESLAEATAAAQAAANAPPAGLAGASGAHARLAAGRPAGR